MFRAAMRDRAALLALGAVLLTGVASAASSPSLVSTAPSRGHVVAVFTSGTAETADTAPAHIAVATKPATQINGSFAWRTCASPNRFRPPRGRPPGLRARTVHKLKPGRYYVKVSTSPSRPAARRSSRARSCGRTRGASSSRGRASSPRLLQLHDLVRACRGSSRRSVRSPRTAAGRGRRSSSAP